MNEKELGKALLHGQEPIDPKALTDRVLQRDRRRMWFWGTLCVIAWLLVVMLPWATILPMLAKIVTQQIAFSDIAANATPKQQHEQAMLFGQAVEEGIIRTFICSVASMFVAAACTVTLIVLSRRVTLRQMNARLAEISHEIRSLAKSPK